MDAKKKPSVYKCKYVAKDDVSQQALFDKIMPEHIENFMSGYNICYAAYGQTGSGKTHTITGPPKSFKEMPEGEDALEHYGLFPRTTIDVWKKIQGNPNMYLTLSMFEDYCMEVKDMSTGRKCRIDPGTCEPDDYKEHKLETF